MFDEIVDVCGQPVSLAIDRGVSRPFFRTLLRASLIRNFLQLDKSTRMDNLGASMDIAAMLMTSTIGADICWARGMTPGSGRCPQHRASVFHESKQGNTMRLMKWSFAILLVAGLTGCQSSLMVRSAAGTAEPTPAPDKALVVFMRPSSFGGAIQSSVYDTHDTADTFIGIVSTKDKIGYQAEPGDHLFMVVAENADFMIAHLDAGKTYYVLVSPRMGMWKARFSLLPIHNQAGAKYSTQSADFDKWMHATSWISMTPPAQQWYADHATDIHAKKVDYMRKWDKADAQQKEELTLKADDGK